MHINGKMIPAKTIPGMAGGVYEGQLWKGQIQVLNI
jgi:hypothetical protein